MNVPTESRRFPSRRDAPQECTEFQETTGPRLRDPAVGRWGEFTPPRTHSFAGLC